MPDENKQQFTYTSHVLTRSQSIQPELLLDVLIISFVKENWITILINLHTAIFFSVFLLASNYDFNNALSFLTMHVGATVFSSIILFFLIRESTTKLLEKKKITVFLLVVCDCTIAITWGLSILFLLTHSQTNEFNTLFSLLLAAGISTAALSAKLLRVLIIGRLLVFLPTMIFLIIQQYPGWLLHSTSIVLCLIISLSIGYAIHIQLLREASLVVEINEARAKTVQEAAFREYFLRSITHDLLQPLSSIKLFARGLRKSSVEMENRPEILSIEMCLASADEILDNVAQLVWVKDQLPKPDLIPVSIDDVLSPLIRIYQPRATEKGLILKYVSSGLFALSEPSYIERAVRNLLENAIEHTQKGKILVGTRNRRSTNEVEIQVLDTGCGIEQKYWGKIFNEYERVDDSIDAKNGHLGLGLSIVYNIANSIDGKATLISRVGKGSCFGLLLPSYDKKSLEKHHMPSNKNIEKHSNQRKTALIIDDDFEYAQFLRSLLLEINIESAIISDVNEIVFLRDKKLPQANYYIVDYHLKKLKGLELLQNVINGSKRILISQINDPEIKAIASESGISFISKSDDDVIMLSRLQKLIQHD